MGSLQSTHFHHEVNSFDSDMGCSHYSSETPIKEIKWKVVPFSSELSQKVLRRVLKLASRLTVEATSGMKSDGIDSKHDVIQCEYYCDTCRKERFITIEFSPDGGSIRTGKYKIVHRTKDSKVTKDCSFSIIERSFNSNKHLKYDILNINKSTSDNCATIWRSVCEATNLSEL